MEKMDNLKRSEEYQKDTNIWSQLPTEILITILTLRPSLVDCIHIKAVCKSWRAAVTKMVARNVHPPSHQAALLIPSKDRKIMIYRVLNLPDKVYGLNIPQASRAICLGSFNEWLVLMDKTTNGCFLFNVTSKKRIQLPRGANVSNSTTNVENVEDFWKHGPGLHAKAILSSDPTSSNCTVVVACLENTLAFCRLGLGDTLWTVWKGESDEYRYIIDMKFYQGRLHIVNYFTKLTIYDLGPHPNLAKTLPVPQVEYPHGAGTNDVAQVFLVESCGELLMVLRIYYQLIGYFRSTFRLFKMNPSGSHWIKVESLRDQMLFLGLPKSRLACFSGDFEGNCIYFANANAGDDSGVFHLEDGSIKPFPSSISYQILSQPRKITPSMV